MKGKTSQLLRGFLLGESAQGRRATTHEEPEWGKKGYDSKAKEMYYLNNFYCFLVDII